MLEKIKKLLDFSDKKQCFQFGRDMLEMIWLMQKQLNRYTFQENHLGDYDEVCDEKDQEDWGGLQHDWVQKYTLAIQQECAELIESTNWKWWRTKVDLFDHQNIKVELIDILHFWVSACQVMGLTAEDVFRMYSQKHRVNLDRLNSGYLEKNEDDCRHIK